MFRVARRMLGDHDAVPDILQEIFMDFYGKLNNGHKIYNPKCWLYKATCNKCVDNLRKRKHHQSIDSVYDLKAETGTAEKQEMKGIVNLAMCMLKPKEKSLVVLYSEGLTYKEIAESTGIGFSSVGKMLSRSLKKMENEFKKMGYELY